VILLEWPLLPIILSGENEKMQCKKSQYLLIDFASGVGLKNIGNTCYFNSMLQTYFALPGKMLKKPANSVDIRKAVLTFPSDIQLPKDDPNKPTVECKLFNSLFLIFL